MSSPHLSRPGSPILGRCRVASAIALATLAFALPVTLPAQGTNPAAGNAASLAAHEKLRQKAADAGTVNVIVGLRLPRGFTAEGRLPGPAAVAQQRADIAGKRDELLTELAGLRATAYGRWASVPSVALKVDAAALEQLLRSPRVTSVQEDSLSPPLLLSAGAWIGADTTWQAGFGGGGQTVAILDNGIDANHPFFGGRVVWEACWSNAGGAGSGASLCPSGANSQTGHGSADFNGAGNCTASLCSHGSHVAGIAAGRDPGGVGYSGTAPEANIAMLQVFTLFTAAGDCSPDPAPCTRTYDSDQISALDYVNNTLRLTYNVSSANMSLGGGNNTSACDGDGRKGAIDNLRSNGIATVIAAGNDGWTNALSTPGCVSTAVTVGAVTDTDNPPADTVTSFSNMHPVVDLLAAGQHMDSSVPDDAYGSKSGTSMATPQVTGAFAVLKAMRPAWTVDEIQNHLASTGVPVTDNRPPSPADAASGITKPRIQLDAAVAALLSADLRIAKDCKPDRPATVAVGEYATCEITVENLGPDPAIGVTLTDRHISDAPFVFGTTAPPAPACGAVLDAGGLAGTVTCNLGAIAAGASATVRVQVAGTDAQDVNDRATVESLTPDPDPGNNVATDGFSVRGEADLRILKSADPDPVVAGTNLTYTLTATNFGPSSAVNVTVEDVLPAGVALVSVTPPAGASCVAGSPGNAALPTRCTLGTLANGASKSVVVVAKVLPQTTGILANNATVASITFDPNNANNSASNTVTVQSLADLRVTKSDSPDPVVAGAPLSYSVVVTNAGPSTALAVKMTDVLPAGVVFTGYTGLPAGACAMLVPGTVTCSLGALDPGAAVNVVLQGVVNASVPDGTVLSNTATVSASTTDPNAANDSATANTDVRARSNLAIAKTASFDVNTPSPRITYTVTVNNVGPSDAQGVVMVDALPLDPKKIVYVFDTGNGACGYNAATHQVTCNAGVLAAGATWAVNIVVDARGSVGRIVNTAKVSATTIDPDLTNNTAVKEIRVKGGPGK